MFEPKDHCKSDELGYKLVIEFNKRTNEYMVTGYSIFNKNNHPYGHISSSQDGATLIFKSMTLIFKSMDEAIASITNYPSK